MQNGRGFMAATGRFAKLLCPIALLCLGIGKQAGAQEVPPPSVLLTLEGKAEPALDWIKCNNDDVSDVALRAFKRPNGQIVAFVNNQADNFPLVGRNLLGMSKDCSSAYTSRHNTDPSAFDDQIWIAATWTDDGIHVMAIGHQEYHGEKVGRCAVQSSTQCRYGSLIQLVSNDSGVTFQKAAAKPLAVASVRQPSDQRHIIGYSQPSNIFEHDGWKYVFVLSNGGGNQPAGTCLMRARAPLDPSSWTIFDGHSFVPSSFDPYVDNAGDHPACAQIPRLNGLVWSVLTMRDTGLLVALLTTTDPTTRAVGLATSTSYDALHWSALLPVPDVQLQWTDKCPRSPMLHYPSLVDPGSSRMNFDDTGLSPKLFLSLIEVINCRYTMNRSVGVVQAKLAPLSSRLWDHN